MSKKAVIIWCVLIAILDGIYCVACSHIPHVQNYMWIGFISLPIYFCGGATGPLFPRYLVCAGSGVLWGVLLLVCLAKFSIFGNSDVNLFIWVTVIVSICCILHIAVLTENVAGGLFSNCPMVFGGFAALFSQGNSEAVWVFVTLTLGLILGLLITIGGKVITDIVDKPAQAKQ